MTLISTTTLPNSMINAKQIRNLTPLATKAVFSSDFLRDAEGWTDVSPNATSAWVSPQVVRVTQISGFGPTDPPVTVANVLPVQMGSFVTYGRLGLEATGTLNQGFGAAASGGDQMAMGFLVDGSLAGGGPTALIILLALHDGAGDADMFFLGGSISGGPIVFVPLGVKLSVVTGRQVVRMDVLRKSAGVADVVFSWNGDTVGILDNLLIAEFGWDVGMLAALASFSQVAAVPLDFHRFNGTREAGFIGAQVPDVVFTPIVAEYTFQDADRYPTMAFSPTEGGATVEAPNKISDGGGNFVASSVEPGDKVALNGGPFPGVYEIATVAPTQLTVVGTPFGYDAPPGPPGQGGLWGLITTAEVQVGTATVNDPGADFSMVQPGDFFIVTGPTGDLVGVYTVDTVGSGTLDVVGTTWPATTRVEYVVVDQNDNIFDGQGWQSDGVYNIQAVYDHGMTVFLKPSGAGAGPRVISEILSTLLSFHLGQAFGYAVECTLTIPGLPSTGSNIMEFAFGVYPGLVEALLAGVLVDSSGVYAIASTSPSPDVRGSLQPGVFGPIALAPTSGQGHVKIRFRAEIFHVGQSKKEMFLRVYFDDTLVAASSVSKESLCDGSFGDGELREFLMAIVLSSTSSNIAAWRFENIRTSKLTSQEALVPRIIRGDPRNAYGSSVAVTGLTGVYPQEMTGFPGEELIDVTDVSPGTKYRWYGNPSKYLDNPGHIKVVDNDGQTTIGTGTFDGVGTPFSRTEIGDILWIFEGPDMGEYVVTAVDPGFAQITVAAVFVPTPLILDYAVYKTRPGEWVVV